MEEPTPSITPAGRARAVGPEIAFAAIQPRKVVIMMLCTGGLYLPFWCYWQWRAIKTSSRFEELSPVLRAIFAPFTSFGLFERIRTYAERRQKLSVPWSPTAMGIAYFTFNIIEGSHRLGIPDWIWLVFAGKIFVILPVQRTINAMGGTPRGFTAIDVVIALIGGTLVVLAVIGTFLPASS